MQPAQDTFKRFTISVTETDIKKGKQGKCSKCPITLAVKRCVRLARGVSVETGPSFILFSKRAFCLDVKLPLGASQFVADFDMFKRLVKPFEFELDVPMVVLHKAVYQVVQLQNKSRSRSG